MPQKPPSISKPKREKKNKDKSAHDATESTPTISTSASKPQKGLKRKKETEEINERNTVPTIEKSAKKSKTVGETAIAPPETQSFIEKPSQVKRKLTKIKSLKVDGDEAQDSPSKVDDKRKTGTVTKTEVAKKKPVEKVPKPLATSEPQKGSHSKKDGTNRTIASENLTTPRDERTSDKQIKSKKIISISSEHKSLPVQKHSAEPIIKAKNVPSPSPESEPEISSDNENNQQDAKKDSEDESVHLHGFSSDDDDSSDEDIMDDEPSVFDVANLPTVAKDDEVVKRRLEKAKRKPTEDRGVLSLSRLPHGFYEEQLKAYFSQFGEVTRVRISRNKKTGKSKHYGFIEFDSVSVAQIVADTMDNYLLMGHIIQCKMIPKEKVHPELWVGANRKWRVVPRDRIVRIEHNKPRTEQQQARATKRLVARQNERKRKLEAAGIDYDFEAVIYKKSMDIKV